MRAGMLRHRIDITSDTSTSDGAGGSTLTPVAIVSNLPATVIELSGRELVNAQAVDARISHRVELRYRDDLTSDMKVQWGARVLRITAVINPDGRRQATHLSCEEVKADAGEA